MCAPRKEGEPWLFYAFRYLADQPRTLVAFVGMAAAVGVYVDHRNFVVHQVGEVLQEVAKDLKQINNKQSSIDTRLEHLEREHEAARKEQKK
jgi:hypothetical protein